MEKEILNDYSKENLDYLKVLKSLNEIKFPVGKSLLIDFLKGDIRNVSIKKNNLYELNNFAELKKYSVQEIKSIIDNLITNSLIDVSSLIGNKFAQVLGITSKGQEELMNPILYKKKTISNLENNKVLITEEEKQLFQELDFFLSNYNNEQKKAIISKKENILCVAGAGSGKTTVLTKRIEFLVKYKSINPERILAITFTRKARQEMESRLNKLGINNVNVETFNSFSEKILKKYNSLVYNTPTRIMNYSDKVIALSFALQDIGFNIESMTEMYFSDSQKKNKEQINLNNIFMNDCFSVIEYFKSKNQELYDFSKDIKNTKDQEIAKNISQICLNIQNNMKMQGLRDYTDQIMDTISFLKKNPQYTPEFDYILIDEYQDVNAMQIHLLDLLKIKNQKVNLFAVGDPRQSIFGWRGSDISYILKFEEIYPQCEIIHLTKNYRSAEKIVNFMNKLINSMKVPNLEPVIQKDAEINIINFNSEEEEQIQVLRDILKLLTTNKGDEIFVLARTNRQLIELSNKFKAKNIPYVLKTDELKKPANPNPGDITLATIHAIKGLEAKIVFIIGCNELNFPCKASDHPVIELIKTDFQDYDKEEEEKRLFYVAVSRAKEKLFLSYSGKKQTYFISPEMLKIVNNSSEIIDNSFLKSYKKGIT